MHYEPNVFVELPVMMAARSTMYVRDAFLSVEMRVLLYARLLHCAKFVSKIDTYKYDFYVFSDFKSIHVL